MFEIGWSEILVIAVVAIVVIGPKDLPRALRTVGQWTGRLKRMAREFQNQFNEAIKEAELDSVQRDIEEIGKIDPIGDMRAAAAQTGADIKRELDAAGTMPPDLPPLTSEPTPTIAPSPDSALFGIGKPAESPAGAPLGIGKPAEPPAAEAAPVETKS